MIPLCKAYTRAEGLPSDQANGVAFDADGNIFVASQCDGIFMADAADDYKTWRQVTGPDELPTVPSGNGLPTNLINDILVAKDGTVYAATDAGLAWSKDKGKTWQFVRGEDWADKVRGLYGGPPSGWKPTNTAAALLAEDYCTCLAEDHEGSLWIGHWRKGCEAIDPKTFLSRPAPTLTKETFVNAILPSGYAQSAAIVGSYGDGAINAGKIPFEALATGVMALPSSPLPSGAKPLTKDGLDAWMKKLDESTASTQPSPVYVGEDWMTVGDWLGRYGRQAAVLCSGGTGCDVNVYWGHTYWIEATIGPNHMPGDGLRYWIHWLRTDNPKVLYNPAVGTRRQAEWDDHAEVYQWGSVQGPDILVSITVPAGVHEISAYFMNKDAHGEKTRNRDFVLQLEPWSSDPSAHDPSLCARAHVCNFWGGVYKTFVVSGPNKYRLRIVRNYSLDTLCSGIFVDRIRGPEFASDKVPKPWMGDIMLTEPPAPNFDLTGLNAEAQAILLQANNVFSFFQSNALTPGQFELRHSSFVLGYRAARSAGVAEAQLQEWRRQAISLWTAEDRLAFTKLMSDAWQSNIKRQAEEKAWIAAHDIKAVSSKKAN